MALEDAREGCDGRLRGRLLFLRNEEMRSDD